MPVYTHSFSIFPLYIKYGILNKTYIKPGNVLISKMIIIIIVIIM